VSQGESEERERRPSGGEDPSEERASTPFDHPFFLPALLIAFTLWFGYDGWLNKDFDPQWISFNRYGFFILAALSAWFTFQAVRETRGKK
jgi:hypothetical protein